MLLQYTPVTVLQGKELDSCINIVLLRRLQDPGHVNTQHLQLTFVFGQDLRRLLLQP